MCTKELWVPVVSKSGNPLMPCSPRRCRKLVEKGWAKRRFKAGLFYLQLTRRKSGDVQPVACGVDPGSKWEGFCVRSVKRTFININLEASTLVKRKMESRRNMRKARRFRKTPCRQNRSNRSCLLNKGMPPSTRSRWGLKVSLLRILKSLFPIAILVVEDIAVRTHKRKKDKEEEKNHWYNRNFSPLQIGKTKFYAWCKKVFPTFLAKPGDVTAKLREKWGLEKTKRKSDKVWEAHAVDAYALATRALGIKRRREAQPDFTGLHSMAKLEFRRRQLHLLQPAKGGERRRNGGTMSLGIKRGSLVKHPKYGVCAVGGYWEDRVSLHHVETGQRLTQKGKVSECEVLTYNYWRTKFLLGLNPEVSLRNVR